MATSAVAAMMLRKPSTERELFSISPMEISNQTSYPVTIYGSGFEAGSILRLSRGNFSKELETQLIDERHLSAIVPAGLEIETSVVRDRFAVEVRSPRGKLHHGSVKLLVINDADYPTPHDLEISPDGRKLFVISPFTDELWAIDRSSGELAKIPTGDGPSGLAIYRGSAGENWLVISHRFSGELWLLPSDGPKKVIPVRPGAVALAVDSAKHRAYLTNEQSDAVQVVDLAGGRALQELEAGVNPGPIALDGNLAWVGARGSDELLRIDLESGASSTVSVPRGGVIIGGNTSHLSDWIMGNKVPRAIAVSKSGFVFAGGIGPNIGPNPSEMAISMNPGVSIFDRGGKYLRHISIGRGMPAAMQVDETRQHLHLADVGAGRIIIFDIPSLTAGDESARKAVVGVLSIRPPDDAPLTRPAGDFSVHGRTSVALHSGPTDLAVAGNKLLVLNRFNGLIAEIDTTNTSSLSITRTLPTVDLRTQPFRRLGEVIYRTDAGGTGITCDACHPDGKDGGLLYTKGDPAQIYRSPNIRGSEFTAPHFTPAKYDSLATSLRVVLMRARSGNPPITRQEIATLTEYVMAMPPPPNPYRGPRGELPRELRLPDGKRGDAVAGLALFEGKGGCSESTCHPPPHFSGDQDARTRGRFFDVGTPVMLPLRLEMQAFREELLPPTSLAGVWDNYPLLYSGAGGFDTDGTIVFAKYKFALRRVLEMKGQKPHGNKEALTDKERDDLLAYLLTL